MSEANIWQPRSILEADADSKTIAEKFTATEGQLLFTLTSFAYAVSTGALTVHKNGLLLTKGTDWNEQTSTTFSIVVACTAGDIVVATGASAMTANVDVRDTDIFIANYQALRDYAGTEVTAYIQGAATHADGGESMYSLVTGEAAGYFVDNGDDIIVPTGGDGSSAWAADDKGAVAYFPTLAAAISSTNSKKIRNGGKVRIGDRGDGLFNIAMASGVTTNTWDIVQLIGFSTLALELPLTSETTAISIGVVFSTGIDNTLAMQRYADIASDTTKSFILGTGTVHFDSITFENAAGINFRGTNPFATILRPFTALGTTPLLKFMPKNVSGAAISGLSMSNFSIYASGYTGTLIDISSVFDSVTLEFLRFDRFAGSAMAFRYRDASRVAAGAYSFIEGVVLKDFVMLGDDKEDFVTTVPMIDFPDGGNEVNMHSFKAYVQRVKSSTVNTAADLLEYNSRPVIGMGAQTRGWSIHDFSMHNAMNTRLIDINNGTAHRIYSYMFERVGEYVDGGLPTTDDSCFIYWRQEGGLNQLNGGSIAWDRHEFPISLRKHYILKDCARIIYNGWSSSPAHFDLSSADNCMINCKRDEAKESQVSAGQHERNVIMSQVGGVAQFANKISVIKRTDTGSKDESASFPTFTWDEGLDSGGSPLGAVKSELTSSAGSLENSRVDITTGVGSAKEQIALSFYRGSIVVGQFAGVPSIFGFNDPGEGAIVYDTVGNRFLFRDDVGFNVVTMTPV